MDRYEGKDEGKLSCLRGSRIIGCCNAPYSYDRSLLTQHEAGGYMVSRLERNQQLKGITFLYSMSGINNTLRELQAADEDWVFLDDLHLLVGSYKVIRLNNYGKRGHNVVRFAWESTHPGNPWLFLIGVNFKGLMEAGLGTLPLDVNYDLIPVQDQLLRISCLALLRGITAWPNVSHVIQVAKGIYKAYLIKKGLIKA